MLLFKPIIIPLSWVVNISIVMVGERMKTISNGGFIDVCYHTGCVYATCNDDPAIYVYDQSTWNRIRAITACKSDGNHFHHTLRVTSNGITLACYLNNCIHVLDHSGTLQQTHGKHGDASGSSVGRSYVMWRVTAACWWLIETIIAARSSMMASGAYCRCSHSHHGQWVPSSLNARSMSLLMGTTD